MLISEDLEIDRMEGHHFLNPTSFKKSMVFRKISRICDGLVMTTVNSHSAHQQAS